MLASPTPWIYTSVFATTVLFSAFFFRKPCFRHWQHFWGFDGVWLFSRSWLNLIRATLPDTATISDQKIQKATLPVQFCFGWISWSHNPFLLQLIVQEKHIFAFWSNHGGTPSKLACHSHHLQTFKRCKSKKSGGAIFAVYLSQQAGLVSCCNVPFSFCWLRPLMRSRNRKSF